MENQKNIFLKKLILYWHKYQNFNVLLFLIYWIYEQKSGYSIRHQSWKCQISGRKAEWENTGIKSFKHVFISMPQRIITMNNENKTIHEFDLNIIYDYFSSTERQGPGSPELTLKALSFIPGLTENSRMADIGCGTGGQTMP